MNLPPLLMFGLLAINGLALLVSFSALLLSLWQPPLTAFGRSLSLFLASQALLNVTAIATLLNRLVLPLFLPTAPGPLSPILANISLASLLLNALAAYGLIVTAAGQMNKALLVIARGGIIGFGLLLWPLWNGQMFQSDDMATFASAGMVCATVAIFFIVLALYIAWRYRRQIRQPALLISLAVLLCGQLLTLTLPPLRLVDFASLLTALVGSVLAYWLTQVQIFEPLRLRSAQISTAFQLVQRAHAHDELPATLAWSVEQARELVHADVAFILLRTPDHSRDLQVSAQSSRAIYAAADYRGRRLPIGEGLAGRAFQTQQPLSTVNYHEWNGRSALFDDPSLFAGLSVPLVDNGVAIGAISVYQREPGRVFSDRDQAAVELLAAQIALVIAFSKALQMAQNALPHTAGDLISGLIDPSLLSGRALAISIAPHLPPLPVARPILVKIINNALKQTSQNSTQAEAVGVLIHTEADTLVIEIGHGSLFVQQAPDRILIRLEPNTSHVTH